MMLDAVLRGTSSRTAFRFAIDMGCPPAMFTVVARRRRGCASAPTVLLDHRLELGFRSTLPLNG
jgi:hypothetical protein